MEQREDGEWTKPPRSPHTGELARVNDPQTWGTFQQAREAQTLYKAHGIGFVFTAEDPFTAIDLDALGDEERAIIAELDTYTEWSPSRRGVHIILKGVKPAGGCKTGHAEIYDRSRFLTITGHIFDGAPALIRDRQAQLETLHARLFPPAPAKVTPRPSLTPPVDDARLWEKMLSHPQDGAKIRDLKECNEGALARLYPPKRPDKTFDWSSADAALCAYLGAWTNKDAARVDRMFRQSNLYRPKWEQREDYRTRTIRYALGASHA